MIDFLFLDKGICYSCKSEKISKFYLCDNCLEKLDYVDNNFKIDSYEARAIYFYNKFIASMIADYKFNRNTSLYKVFASMIEEYLDKNVDFLNNVDYILPVPSTNRTINNRGFDHIKLICDFFTKKYKINYLDGFEKIKYTRAQHTLSLDDRLNNLKGAFTCSENLKGKSVLVFDDIITSGNTFREIARVLKSSGAQNIKILSITSSHKVI